MQIWARVMNYLKLLGFNFLAVFFTNYVMPGIEIVHQTKLPHIGGDLLFALALGIVNTLIYPVLKVLDQKVNLGRIATIAAVISFASYALLKFVRFGIEVKSVEGYLFAAICVAAVGFLTNFFEMTRGEKPPKPPEIPRAS